MLFAHSSMKTTECVCIHLCCKCRSRRISACRLRGYFSLWWGSDSGKSLTHMAAVCSMPASTFPHVSSPFSLSRLRACSPPPPTIIHCFFTGILPAAGCSRHPGLIPPSYLFFLFALLHTCLSLPSPLFPESSFHLVLQWLCTFISSPCAPATLHPAAHFPRVCTSLFLYVFQLASFAFFLSLSLSLLPARPNMTHPGWHLRSNQVPSKSSVLWVR